MEGYFFSPTGTGRALAHLLSQAHWVDLTVSRAREGVAPPPEGRLLTLIFPVYAHGVPVPLVRWLRRLPPGAGPVCLLTVYGGVSPGGALRQAARLISARGRSVIAAAALPGPHSYDCAPGIPQIARRWDGVEDFYRRAVEKAARAPAAAISLGGPVLRPPQRLLARLTAPYPAADPEKCNGCGICKAICPVGAAQGDSAHCIRCTACVRCCPKGARSLRFYCKAPILYINHRIKQSKAPRFYL